MDILYELATVWSDVVYRSTFSDFFEWIFTPFSEVVARLLNPLGVIEALPPILRPVYETALDLVNWAFGDLSFFAVLFGFGIFVFLVFHIFKLIFEALPIL